MNYFCQMNFADYYFSRYNAQPTLFENTPKSNVGIIVVIPCYDDFFVFDTLQSLEKTNPTETDVEVIIVVNSGINTPTNIVQKNNEIYTELKARSELDFYKRVTLLPVIIENIPKKIAGVGYARKTGMDEAVRRFSAIDKPDGIIVSLDADSLVSKNYFTAIENHFCQHPKNGAFTFQFQHDFNPSFYSKEEIEACTLYEIYLRYFRLALLTTAFPYCFHTIGSCFGVKASAYIKVGGMPCKQGGEDFYFLHKLAPMTSIGEVKKTLVFPAPRLSDRVPFGTGPSVKNIIENNHYYVYNFELFTVLKRFFDALQQLANAEKVDLSIIPKEIISFVGKEKLSTIIDECRKNAKPGKNLAKRLFSKFDAFFIVKFLNSFDAESDYPPMDVLEAAALLLKHYKIIEIDDIYSTMLKLDYE